jgi:hypothetical protein
MTPSETGELLANIQAFDHRTVGEADLMAWHAILKDVPIAPAKAAVLTHFGESKEWLTPVDIKNIIGRERSRRIGSIPSVVPPWQLADRPSDEIRWVAEYRHAIADGLPQETAVAKANYLLGIEDAPLAIEPPEGLLHETLERGEREMADKARMAQIKAEVERQAKEKRRADQAETEKKRTAERKPEPTREVRDPAEVIASHVEQPEETTA